MYGRSTSCNLSREIVSGLHPASKTKQTVSLRQHKPHAILCLLQTLPAPLETALVKKPAVLRYTSARKQAGLEQANNPAHDSRDQVGLNLPKKRARSGIAPSRRSAEDIAQQLVHSQRAAAELLDKDQPGNKQLTRVLAFLNRWGHSTKAVEVLNWADKQAYLVPSRAFFYSQMLSGPSSKGRGSEAAEMYHRMQSRGILQDLVSYNTLICALGKAGHWKLTQQAFSEMQKQCIRPDVYTYSSLIKACQSCGSKWREAMYYFARMKEEGVQPNVVTYTTLISCCQRGGQWSKGMQFFRDLECSGLELDTKAFNAMISACATGAKWEDAWHICMAMKYSGVLPDVRTYNALISACERANQADRALEVFSRMQKDAVRRREAQPSLVTYNTLMSTCAKAGLFHRVGELYKLIQSEGIKPDAFTQSAMIMACKQCGYWEEAIEFVSAFEQQHGIKLNTVTCNTLISTLGAAGRWQYAQQYFAQLNAGGLEGRPDSWSYAAIILACRKGQQFSLVLEYYEELKRTRLRVYKDVYLASLEACERLSLWTDGRQILQQLKVQEEAPSAAMNSLDIAAWNAVFAFPPLMDSVPKPIITAARVAVDSGRKARQMVTKRERN